LAAQTSFDLGYQVFREAQILESLLQDLSGVLRLAAVALEAFLRCAATALSGFGLFFRISLRGRHGAFLRCIWVLCGGSLPKRMRQRPSLHGWQRESALRNAFPALSAVLCWCCAVQMGQEDTHAPCPVS
jgi:hypothetical protein